MSALNSVIEKAWRGMESKLAPAVSRKLGCEAVFLGWTREDKQGAVSPIFSVPKPFQGRARELGLTIV